MWQYNYPFLLWQYNYPFHPLPSRDHSVVVRMEEEEGNAYGAFIQRFELRPQPQSPPLPLQGLTFAVKDIFDISGYVTGFGNPDWARSHAPATSTAPTVLAVIKEGAICVGKTIMDEMAYSINGENVHYGTPVNPCVPDRVPGGSSSGSAVAVAAGLVDFSLGTDTGGSVRVPAGYCGIYGFRPSHDVISTSNVIPMSQSFDTVGWFARDPYILSRVGHVLLSLPVDATQQPTRFVIPEDVFQYLGSPADQVSHIVIRSVEKIFGHNVLKYESLGDYICDKVPSLSIFMSKISGDKSSAFPAFAALSYSLRLLQRFEFKTNHEKWLKTTKPNLGPGISERVSEALEATSENIDCVKTTRAELEAALTDLLEDHGVLAIPTVPGPPPKLRTETAALENFRVRAFSLLSIAGMSRFCQVTLPLGMHDGLPVSVSLLARHGADHFLLNIAQAIYGTLKEEATIAWEVSK